MNAFFMGLVIGLMVGAILAILYLSDNDDGGVE